MTAAWVRRFNRRQLYRAARKVGKRSRWASVRYVLRATNARWNRV